MNIGNLIDVPSTAAFDGVQSSMWERLTNGVRKESLCEVILIAVTSGLLGFLSYTFYYALHNYGAL
jgi:hypothetical protein